jgi:hypothetical protein
MRQRPSWCCRHHAAKGEDNRVEGEIAAWAAADLVVGDRVEVLVDQPGGVVVLFWETGGAGILASKGDDCEIDDLDVVAPAGQVPVWLNSDSGAGGGGKGLSDNALDSFVPGHPPWLPLERQTSG